MPNINQYQPRSGRQIKEDGSAVNVAEMVESLYKALVINKDAGMQLTGSNVIQPSDIQSHYQQTIQTHNAVSVPATTGQSVGSWFDGDGFNDIGITAMNDAVANSTVVIQWSNDGTNKHGDEVAIATSTLQYKTAIMPLKSRYFRIILNNTDAAAHTMSAWVFLKA